MSETIVAAAIRFPVDNEFKEVYHDSNRVYPDFLTVSAPPPARHHTLLHPTSIATNMKIGPDNQGFLTSTGRYVSREEAYRIAVEAKQEFIPHKSHIPGVLYSEDLW